MGCLSAETNSRLDRVGYLEKNGDHYVDSPKSAAFLDAQHPEYVGGYVRNVANLFWTQWAEFTELSDPERPPCAFMADNGITSVFVC